MKINFKIFLFSALIFVNLVSLAGAQVDEFSAGGTGAKRIEEEDKIFVPLDKIDEVWNFINENYVKNTEELKKIDPLITAYAADEDFTDTYFDTPTLQLLAKNDGIRHRKRTNLTNAADVKSGRELMQIKLSNISNNPLQRNEIKFDIQYPTDYLLPDDSHPVLGIIEPSQRAEFKNQVSALGVDPYALKPILTLYDRRQRVYWLHDNKPFISFSLDHVTANLLWAKAEFSEIEPELNEVTFTEADAKTRQYMEQINDKIRADLKEKLPYLKSDLTPKYNKVFNQFAAQIPFLRLLIRINETIILAILIVGLGLVFGIYFLVKKLSKRVKKV